MSNSNQGSSAAPATSGFDETLSMDAWKKVVDVQMHFNDICMRVRGLFLTAVVAIIAAAGYSLSRNFVFGFPGLSVNIVILALLAGWLTCFLFYLLDYKHYHQFLLASVEQGKLLENSLGAYWNGATLGHAITNISSNNKFGSKLHEKMLVKFGVVVDERAKKNPGALHSDGRLLIFYRLPMNLFQTLFVISLFTYIQLGDKTPAQWTTRALTWVVNQEWRAQETQPLPQETPATTIKTS